jgi:hypothetical protein
MLKVEELYAHINQKPIYKDERMFASLNSIIITLAYSLTMEMVPNSLQLNSKMFIPTVFNVTV